MNIDHEEAKAVLETAKKLQRMHRMRKEIDAYVNDSLAYIPGHVRDALKEPRGALTVEMTDTIVRMKSNKVWGMIQNGLEYELGSLSLEQLINALRVLPVFTSAMGLMLKEDALPKPKKPEALLNDAYFKTIVSCLSGNTYRMMDEIVKRLDEKEPLFSHSDTRLRQSLALLVQQGKVVHKKLFTGQDSWRKPRRKSR